MSTLASDEMSAHNPRERRLFRDLHEKSVLTRQVQRLASSMRRLQARVAKRRSHRWRAQYTNSIRRAATKVEELEQQVLSRAQELRLRLQEELEVSVEEVQAFEEQHKKEVMELKGAHQALRTAEQALSGAELASEAKDKADRLAELRHKHRRAERQAREEAKDVKAVEQELASEARDREILTVELHKLLEEIELLRPEVAGSNTQTGIVT